MPNSGACASRTHHAAILGGGLFFVGIAFLGAAPASAQPTPKHVVSYVYSQNEVPARGTFRLFDGGTFLDASGQGGVWAYVASSRLLFVRYAAGVRCGARFIGQVSSSRSMEGRLDCTDGSGGTGFWNGKFIAPFVMAEDGCPMAHCDSRMSDFAGEGPPPAAGAAILSNDPALSVGGEPMGSEIGAGCSTNGTVAACSLGELPESPETVCNPEWQDTLVVFDYAGGGDMAPVRKWSSGSVLSCFSWTSAPLLGGDGGVIQADEKKVVRFGPDGGLLWSARTPGGIPISLVPVGGHTILSASLFGPVSTYDAWSGVRRSVLDLAVDDGRYETVNTPAVRGNRAYLATHFSLDYSKGRLYAIDVGPAGELSVAWFVEFGGPSGASPLIMGDMIYFDGDGLTPMSPVNPHVIAVRDEGSSGSIVWSKDLQGTGRVRASFAEDPRGGLWLYHVGSQLIRLDAQDGDSDGEGDLLQEINLDALIDEPGEHRPTSVMTIYGSAANPVMLVSAAAFTGQTATSVYVVAVELNTGGLLWKVQVPTDRFIGAQFPSINGPFGPRALFTNPDGIWTIGAP